jgi:hypothetical protein
MIKILDQYWWAPIVFGCGMALATVLLAEPEAKPGPEVVDQEEVMCFSGGHMIWYDVCEECHMTVGGVVQGVDTDGKKFAVSGDCVLVPVGYEPGVAIP